MLLLIFKGTNSENKYQCAFQIHVISVSLLFSYENVITSKNTEWQFWGKKFPENI